jgi:hypothetical protein
MAKVFKIQSVFTGGEISPRLLARVDVKAYDNSVKTMLNAYPLTHGGAKRRPGSIYVGEVKTVAEKARLLPFVYSKTQSYMVVFNGGKVQFIKDRGFIESSPGTRYEINSPYAEADLPDIEYAQSGNTMFLCHPNHPPKRLTRLSDTNWTLADIPFVHRAVTDQWFENSAIRFKIIGGTTAFSATQTFTVVTNGTGGITSTSGPTGSPGNGAITGVTATVAAPAETWTITCVSATSTRQEWTVSGSVSGTARIHTWTSSNYPAAVSFFEQRLYLAGTPTAPQTIWGSQIGDYTNFTLGALDNDAVMFTIASNKFDQIIHLEAARQLLPLTYGGEFTMQGATAGITPSAVRIRAQTFHGSCAVKPLRIAQEVLFVQRDMKKVRAIAYSVAEDANMAPDITLFAEHITGDGFTDATFTQDPDYIAWFTRADGVLCSLTHMREQSVTAWARHTTVGEFEQVETISESDSDVTYLVVKRTIDGSTVRNVEYFDYQEPAMTDCSVFGESVTAEDEWSGLDHLEGEEVAIVADGVVHPNRTVESGTVTLDFEATEVEIGLPYVTQVELLHPELQLADGTVQGRQVRVEEATLRFQDSVGCVVDNYEIPFRQLGDPMDSPIPPFTGDKKVKLLGWRSPRNLSIEQRLPLPWTLLGVVMKVSVADVRD